MRNSHKKVNIGQAESLKTIRRNVYILWGHDMIALKSVHSEAAVRNERILAYWTWALADKVEGVKTQYVQ